MAYVRAVYDQEATSMHGFAGAAFKVHPWMQTVQVVQLRWRLRSAWGLRYTHTPRAPWGLRPQPLAQGLRPQTSAVASPLDDFVSPLNIYW